MLLLLRFSRYFWFFVLCLPFLLPFLLITISFINLWIASTPRMSHAGRPCSGTPALEARRPGGLFPFWRTPVVPRGPSPGARMALPGCRVMAYRDQSHAPCPSHTDLPKSYEASNGPS